MNERTRQKIEELLSDPIMLKQKKPFTRGTTMKYTGNFNYFNKTVGLNETVEATLPFIKMDVVTQDDFIQELDPMSHSVLYDENIPSIVVKTTRNGYMELNNRRMSVPYQRLIRDKHVLHLCGNPMVFTLMDTEPTDTQMNNFIKFKQYWNLRNMDGMRTKMVSAQKSVGDAGLLFYFDYKGQIKARLLSYEDGYVLCPHNDDNGDRILESVYYKVGDTEYIDSYDDTYMYRYVCGWGDDSVDSGQWKMLPPKPHGFSEIPLVTKRGKVAWDNVQTEIEVYEIIYNIFLVIQKKYGHGILYVKGQFKDKAKQIAGNIILNDTSMDGKGSAQFLTPPTPQNMVDVLGLIEETIQKGSGATFLLPKDVKSSGDISAQAIMLTQSLDIETALQGVIDWQNVADKMCRLFAEGLSKELVNNGENPFAITEFQDLHINAKFKVWRPQNDSEYNSMLIQLAGAGLISKETGIDKNTESSPDEKVRLGKERDENLQYQMKQYEMQSNIQSNNNVNNNNNQNSGQGDANNV